MHFKYDQNLLLLWIFLILQIAVLVGYLKFSSTWSNDLEKMSRNLEQPIKFLKNSKSVFSEKLRLMKSTTYYNSDNDNEIYLRSENVESYFTTINDTVCFKFGSDTRYIKKIVREINRNGKCECLPGYHGNDCSLPEVIWRAFIAYRQETIIHKRSTKARRIIHMFKIVHPAQIPLAVIKINELFNTVDLFVVAESNRTQFGEAKPFHFKLKLDKGLCKDKQHKILFTPIYEWSSEQKTLSQLSWEKSQKIIKNLKQDDLFLQLESSEIPNPKSLLFFKLYDGFSLPLQFRLKWNVYGYYFQHPNKTKKVTSGSTVQMLKEVYKNNPDLIANATGLTIGDLNHYGGWFCDLCYDTKDMLNVIQTFSEFENILPLTSKVIDKKYLEDVIGDGIYVDGKTLLISNYEGRNNYYSPEFVAKYYWKFDSLMTNFYNKIDYN